jgi:hypothetical protein
LSALTVAGMRVKLRLLDIVTGLLVPVAILELKIETNYASFENI